MIEIELAATVRAVEKTVQRTLVPYVFLPSSPTLPHPVDGLPGILVDYRGLRILRDDPVRLSVERGLVRFVGDVLPPVADCVSAVLIPVEDVQN